MSYTHAGTLPDSANTLGGIALPVQTRWLNQRQVAPYLESRVIALDGSSDYIVAPLQGGQPIDLEIARPYSWLYEAKYQLLKALRDGTPGQTITLVWDSVSMAVRFRRFDGEPLDFAPLARIGGQPAPIDLAVYEGVIRLITV